MRVLLLLLGLFVPLPATHAGPLNGTVPPADEYPLELKHFEFSSQGQELQMAYMDTGPSTAESGTVVLLHGKNFCGPYWYQTIDPLQARGFRVVVVEQVGFCRSSLPEHYQFTLHQLAHNTRALLDELEISSARIMGHSMGGMLAMRFALLYPDTTEQLILLNPIGLEDWLAEGVPYTPIDALFEAEQKKDFDSIRTYQKESYYDGEWEEEYARWARMLADTYTGEQGKRVAWNHALTADMVMTQPVIHQAGNIRAPTVLMIGGRDRTAIGRDRVDDALAARLGNYPRLSRNLADALPDAELVLFDDVGHMPHVEAPQRYLEALIRALAE